MIEDGPTINVPRLEDYATQPPANGLTGGRRMQEIAGVASGLLPLVSVVTIVRNGAKTLQRTLDSVLSQDYPEIEYIVVDGGSTDGTLDVLRANQSRLALWISEPDHGISDAFNKGIALSRGKFVGLLNSDDWYEPDAIREVATQMQASAADIACGRIQYWEAEKRTYLTSSDPSQLRRAMTIGHPTVFVRRDSYHKYGLFRLDFRLAMDYEWLLRASRAGAQFLVVDRCLANMQGGGVGDRLWRDSQREVAKARALHLGGADNAFAYHFYVWRRILMGNIRRVLDATGLGVLRRAYHRWLSPVTVISNRDDFKD